MISILFLYLYHVISISTNRFIILSLLCDIWNDVRFGKTQGSGRDQQPDRLTGGFSISAAMRVAAEGKKDNAFQHLSPEQLIYADIN